MKTNTFEISSTQLLEKLKSFSKQDYEKYNPIVLYGNSGTGKTYLLKTLCNTLKEKNEINSFRIFSSFTLSSKISGTIYQSYLYNVDI